MTDGYDARTFGNAVDLSSPLPSWEQPTDIMDGFDQFMALLPSLTAPAAGSSACAPEPVKEESSVQTSVPDRAIEKMSSLERRQHKNKVAQKRFRDRQKVCAVFMVCTETHDH